jgi:hypothetical protein
VSIPANGSAPSTGAPSPSAASQQNGAFNAAGSAGGFSLHRAEELLSSLPGVISARIIEGTSGSLGDIHVLTTADVAAKQTVRNVESALIAQFGLRVDHRKISVATTAESAKPRSAQEADAGESAAAAARDASRAIADASRRRLYFEDVELRRSAHRGAQCRVTLRKGDATYAAEADGPEGARSRIELAARATLAAIVEAEGDSFSLSLEGAKLIDAFEHDFVFVGVSARVGRGSALLTGSCEVKDSPETASVLAVLDATNRWVAVAKER